jgi:hypothetical protein
MTTEQLNFSTTEAAENKEFKEYLKPGMYMMKPISVKKGESSKKNTPFIEVTFEAVSKNEDYNGKTAKSKFYITAGALGRLQLLHEGMSGKKLAKDFKSSDEVSEYFTKIIEQYSDKFKRPMIAGGSISEDGKKMYSDIPYAGFFVPEEHFEEMEFQQNDARWKAAITSDNKKYTPSETPSSDEGMVFSSSSSNDDDGDLPF